MRDLRGAVRSRLLALGLFLGAVAIGVVVLPMLVLGPTVLKRITPHSTRATFNHLIDALYYPVVVVLLLIGLTTLYHLAPPRRLPWRRGMPGAILAIVLFLAGAAGLRTYITFIVEHNHAAYGTIAAPIAALLFFYVLALGVLLGAEFNAAIEQHSPSKPRTPRILNPREWQRADDTDRTGVTGRRAGRSGFGVVDLLTARAHRRPGLGRLGHREDGAADRLD
jgi:membrane protein